MCVCCGEQGVAADGRNSRGESALHKAALAGRPSAIRWLLDNKDFHIDINSVTKYATRRI